jgi:flavodoxin
MRYTVLIILLLTYMSLSGQVRNFSEIPKDILSQLDKMGTDSTPLLDSCESAYFNVIFKDNLDGFDFTNKKIGFLSAGSKRNKKEYFAEERKRFYDNSTTINSTLYIFNASQKRESGGYDAAIVYWSKFILPTDKVVKKLKK